MHTVILLQTRTVTPFDQYQLGTIECDGRSAPVVQPGVAQLADWLFQDVDRADPTAVITAMHKAPTVFDGGYLRAAYEES